MTTAPDPRVVAVAYVIDSSLALASEWGHVLPDYIIPLLQRLGELHPGRSFRIGVVSYATSDTRPTPLVGKTYFGPPQTVIKDFRENPGRIGIGVTGSACPRGTAALEGLVAAIEMFDSLRGSAVETFSAYIIHVAATMPDGAEQPVWNSNPTLDDLSWDTLPSHLQKRDIYYCNIQLKQIPRFADVHASVAAGAAQNPWFALRPQHTIQLSGFQQRAPGMKRGVEGPATPERNQDAKRPRVQTQPPQSSPKISNAPSSTSQIPSSQPSAQPAPSNPQQAPARTFPALLMRKKHQVEELRKAGRNAEAMTVEKEIYALLQQFQAAQKLKNPGLNPSSGSQIPASQSQNGHMADHGIVALGSDMGSRDTEEQRPVGSSTQLPASMRTAIPDPPLHEPPTIKTEPSTQTFPPSFSSPSQPPRQPPQPQQSRFGIVSQAPTNPLAVVQEMLDPQRNQPPPQPAPMPISAQPNNAGPSSFPPNSQVIWEGFISWAGGPDASGRVPQTQAILVSSQHVNALRTCNFPSTMALGPSSDHTLPQPFLLEWLKQHHTECAVVYMVPQNKGPDAKKHEESFSAMTRILQEKNIYAYVAFIDNNGMRQNRMLLTAARGNLWLGAFFLPPNPMPKLPKPEVCGIPLTEVPREIAAMLMKLSPAQQAQLNTLPQDKRLQALLATAQRQRQMMLQQQQQQQKPQQLQQPQPPPQQQQSLMPQTVMQPAKPSNNKYTSIVPFINGVPPSVMQVLGPALTGTGGTPPQQPLPNPNMHPGANTGGGLMPQGIPGAAHRRTPSGGGVSGAMGGGPQLSLEMIQSFMHQHQRNQDGGGMNSGGMNGGGMNQGFGM